MKCDDPQQFIDKLQEIHDKGSFLFRGVTEAHFPSMPKAFREKEMKEYSKQFPQPETTIREWSSKVIKDVENNKALASTPIMIIFTILWL